jgi:hypothetical protein
MGQPDRPTSASFVLLVLSTVLSIIHTVMKTVVLCCRAHSQTCPHRAPTESLSLNWKSTEG